MPPKREVTAVFVSFEDMTDEEWESELDSALAPFDVGPVLRVEQEDV